MTQKHRKTKAKYRIFFPLQTNQPTKTTTPIKTDIDTFKQKRKMKNSDEIVLERRKFNLSNVYPYFLISDSINKSPIKRIEETIHCFI